MINAISDIQLSNCLSTLAVFVRIFEVQIDVVLQIGVAHYSSCCAHVRRHALISKKQWDNSGTAKNGPGLCVERGRWTLRIMVRNRTRLISLRFGPPLNCESHYKRKVLLCCMYVAPYLSTIDYGASTQPFT